MARISNGWFSITIHNSSKCLQRLAIFSEPILIPLTFWIDCNGPWLTGEDTAPNRWVVIMNSSGSRSRLPSGHQRNRKALRSLGFTSSWWNIASTSDMYATGSWRNLVNTSTREFVRSGPCRSSSLRDLPWYLAEQSNTTHTFPGFAGCWTAWWGSYNVLPGTSAAWTFVAYPLFIRSSMQSLYLDVSSGSLDRRRFSSLRRCFCC